MTFKGRKSSTKSPPFFSHEFVIQNHADIISCAALVFVVGLMVQSTNPYAYMFIALHHNTSDIVSTSPDPVNYTYGIKDFCAIFFYFLICVVLHAILQEYIVDKVTKRLHLSKTKQSKFNESGQLLCFYIMSICWGAHIILKENYVPNVSSLWEGYPHTEMSFMFKFFFIIQMSYWLHTFPELYFQKVKKEDIFDKVCLALVSLAFIASFYFFNFTRVGVCLLVIHYISEVFYHITVLISLIDKEERGKLALNMIWQGIFFVARFGSLILAVLTFWYGLSNSVPHSPTVEGDFNTPTIRIGALLGVGLLQVYLMFNFITDALKIWREATPVLRKLPSKKPLNKKRDLKKVNKEYDELPEVDQNTKKSLKKIK